MSLKVIPKLKKRIQNRANHFPCSTSQIRCTFRPRRDMTGTPLTFRNFSATATGKTIENSSSPENWRFLFEDVFGQAESNKLPHRKPHGSPPTPSNRPRNVMGKPIPIIYKTPKKVLSAEEKEAFNKIFATLFEKPRFQTVKEVEEPIELDSSDQGMSTIERHLIELIKRKEGTNKANGDKNIKPSSTYVRKNSRDHVETGWFNEHFDVVPSISRNVIQKTNGDKNIKFQSGYAAKTSEHTRTGWLSEHFDAVPSTPRNINSLKVIQNRKQSEEAQAISSRIKNEMLQYCLDNRLLLQFVWERIFKDMNSESGTDPQIKFDPQYATLLEQAMYLSRTVFSDPYMVLSIFEQAKRKGIESYVRGVSTRVYNEVLQTRWEYWRDINGIEQLVKEMKFNGVEFDKDTLDFVQKISIDTEPSWGPEERRSLENIKELIMGRETRKKFDETSNSQYRIQV
ncbi:hypothetical protein G9A89_008173 [Geosiphon pyriformis]|nr:hypothetical protein G9A89_008173 [Geosiphon pyriformis]